MKPASTPRILGHKNDLKDSVTIDMLSFGVTIPATVPQRSEIPEGLKNYPVFSPHIAFMCLLFLLTKKEHFHKQQ
jgi:hypothetical protein